jgi:P-type conjugative transfer protein TrbJ
MRRFLLATAILSAGLVPAPQPAHAQLATVCTNCDTIAQQLLDYARQGQQYLTEMAQLQTNLQQYANMVQNTVALPQQIWANVQSDISQVRGLANAASLLTGNSGTILTRLNTAGAYFNQLNMTPQQLENQLTVWQQTLGNSGNSLARTLGVQQGQEQNYTALQAAISAHSQTAAGQMEAIQAGNESLGLINTQLQQVQTTLTTAAQETATRDIVAADRQAAADAQWQDVFANAPMPATTGGQTMQFQ